MNRVNHVDANRLGVVGAVLMAGWHAAWLLLQATGQGQRVMDFIFRIHGMKSDVVVEPFDLGTAVVLLLTTALAGYVFMALGGLLWNCLSMVCVRGGTGVATRA
jgi:hypothetical protein